MRVEQSKVAIPIKPTVVSPNMSLQQETPSTFGYRDGNITISGTAFDVRYLNLPLSKKTMIQTPWTKLKQAVRALAEHQGMVWSVALENELPRNWEKHGDLVLLPETCLFSPEWNVLGMYLYRWMYTVNDFK